jgi:hypothetical protein
MFSSSTNYYHLRTNQILFRFQRRRDCANLLQLLPVLSTNVSLITTVNNNITIVIIAYGDCCVVFIIIALDRTITCNILARFLPRGPV